TTTSENTKPEPPPLTETTPCEGVCLARSIQAGMAHVNDQPVNDLPFNPFGGEKNSGIGRFNGRWAIDAFTTDQWVTLQHTPRPYPSDARAPGDLRKRGRMIPRRPYADPIDDARPLLRENPTSE